MINLSANSKQLDILLPNTNRALAEAWINYTLEAPVSRALTLRQGLPNTLEDSPTLHKADKIIWLQQVENISRRESLWDKIISGEVPDGSWL